MNVNTKAWISAARPRTLFLAVASILMGIFLAFAEGQGSFLIAGLCLTTAAALQILSNFANDYGDARHGLDNDERVGPKRAVQTGVISSKAMLRAMIISAIIAVICGLTLLISAFSLNQLLLVLLFVALGGAGIWAAIAYTATDNPYGYVGLGDLMVFVFFGLVAVIGSYFLQTNSFSVLILLPAISSGLLSVAVLNVNNVRDLDSDKKAGKSSIPVRLGAKNARIYHLILLTLAFLSSLLYVTINFSSYWQFLFLLSSPLLIMNGVKLWQGKTAKDIDPLLKQMSISALVFTILFGIGQII